MKVILRENIESLGKKGDIVNIARGYARNYLIPKDMAIEVTSRNMKMIEIEQKALRKGFEKERASYQELLDRLNTTTLSFTRKTSEKDVIFGSVSATDIKDALDSLGLEVEKKKILLEEPIKRLGNYTVPIKVFHEERAGVKIQVVREGAPGVMGEIEQEPPRSEEKADVLEPTSDEEKVKEELSPVKDEAQAGPPEKNLKGKKAVKEDAPPDSEEATRTVTEETPVEEKQKEMPETENVEIEENTEGTEQISEKSEEISEYVEEDSSDEKARPQEVTEESTSDRPLEKANKE